MTETTAISFAVCCFCAGILYNTTITEDGNDNFILLASLSALCGKMLHNNLVEVVHLHLCVSVIQQQHGSTAPLCLTFQALILDEN